MGYCFNGSYLGDGEGLVMTVKKLPVTLYRPQIKEFYERLDELIDDYRDELVLAELIGVLELYKANAIRNAQES
ncbi:hypothetical protein AH03_3 [Erwinia phage AH03]|uniref:Uncharacterized protein n=1 Tax=Erwinia phage AH03 TaxID=2869568 RepID=A0AAE7X237_9CAUD|nr:hypothetical protein AH03_3 [Erwinia phage AH03]